MDKKPTFKDIFNVNIRYLEYLLAKSYLSHQYLKNIKLTGDQVESEFRKMFSSLLPRRYKVTHGYIASAPNKEEEPIVSHQVDMIIVDTLVPHSIFVIEDDGMELVPIESVVGIFEIKRTIDPDILDKALDHLFDIQTDLNIKKTDSKKYFPTGIQGIGVMYSNPLIGILSLVHKDYEGEDEYKKRIRQKN